MEITPQQLNKFIDTLDFNNIIQLHNNLCLAFDVYDRIIYDTDPDSLYELWGAEVAKFIMHYIPESCKDYYIIDVYEHIIFYDAMTIVEVMNHDYFCELIIKNDKSQVLDVLNECNLLDDFLEVIGGVYDD